MSLANRHTAQATFWPALNRRQRVRRPAHPESEFVVVPSPVPYNPAPIYSHRRDQII